MREVHAAEGVGAEVFVAVGCDWGLVSTIVLSTYLCGLVTEREKVWPYHLRIAADTRKSRTRRSVVFVVAGRLG